MSHYELRDSEGRFVGSARGSVAAHRSSRRAGRLGSSVNRVIARIPVTQVVVQQVQQGRSKKWVAKAYGSDGYMRSGWRDTDRESVARKIEESWPGVPVYWNDKLFRTYAGVEPYNIANIAALSSVPKSDQDVRIWVSPNGVEHTIIRGHCATCGRYHPDDANRAGGGRKKVSTQIREHVLRVAAIDLMTGKRLEVRAPGGRVIYMGESKMGGPGGSGHYYYEHTGGRTYKETPEVVLAAVLPRVGIDAIEQAVRYS
jgi:hypothetical protein